VAAGGGAVLDSLPDGAARGGEEEGLDPAAQGSIDLEIVLTGTGMEDLKLVGLAQGGTSASPLLHRLRTMVAIRRMTSRVF
jgi:hypothetical protein